MSACGFHPVACTLRLAEHAGVSPATGAHLGDFVEHDCSFPRQLEFSRFFVLGPGEGSPVVAKQLGYRGEPERVPLPPGEQRRSVLDGSLVRRQFNLPPWTPIEKGLEATAAWFRSQRV